MFPWACNEDLKPPECPPVLEASLEDPGEELWRDDNGERIEFCEEGTCRGITGAVNPTKGAGTPTQQSRETSWGGDSGVSCRAQAVQAQASTAEGLTQSESCHVVI